LEKLWASTRGEGRLVHDSPGPGTLQVLGVKWTLALPRERGLEMWWRLRLRLPSA
jgi:hypothetical protein